MLLVIIRMFTSKTLKGKQNLALGPCMGQRRPYFGLGLCVVFALMLPGQGICAGLTLGEPAEQTIEDAVEDSVEDQIEEQAEDSALDNIEDQVEERVLTLGGGFIQQRVEEEVENSVEESIEEAVEDTISDNIEVVVEESIEDEIAQELEETIETIVEESVEDRVEENITENVAETVEETIEETVEEELAAAVEQELEQGVEDNLESAVDGAIAEAVEERLEDDIDQILERIEIDESRIHKGQWLVMAEPEVFERLAKEGYLFDTVTELPGMGLRLAEVAAPSSFDITEVRQGVIDVVGGERAEVDLNHIYTAGDEVIAVAGEGVSPRTAVNFPADTDELPLRIGMIDSLVDVSHPALSTTRIQTRSFASAGAELPSFHGTAIASIIAANGSDYTGLAPKAEVYAAAVFEQDARRGEIASTVSLVRALDWLMSSGVDVVNISLAGPPNRLLEAALERAAERNVMILAAAGNGGPVAQPMYPAAYSSVVAVTAVDASGQVFRLANRGEYLDIAAPGVEMRHARAGGGYTASSGTSFAVPFAATAAARLRQLNPADDALEALYRSAQDLGPPGRDNIYGYGLLRPAS